MKLTTLIITAVLGTSTVAVAQPSGPYARSDHYVYGDQDNMNRPRRWRTITPSIRNRGDVQIVRLGADIGQFEKLRIRMDAGQMFVGTVGVVFNNGSMQRVRVRRYLQAGDTVDVDLPFSHRSIRRIQLFTGRYKGYRATGAFTLLAEPSVTRPQYGYREFWPYRRY